MSSTAIVDPALGSVTDRTARNRPSWATSSLGTYTAMNAQTGAVLWTAASGSTSCAAGAAISQGMVFWGTGYNQIKFQPIQPGRVSAFTTQ